ncbi:MAG: hypothetical protein HY862_03665 [Chloroflexi bacterium]|nr:hypothetical protein [Chloroflexota bacterium]
MNDDKFLQALAAAYEADRRALLLRIADAATAGQAVYTPQTALEVVFVMQLERAEYVTLVPLEVHPEYPDMVVRVGATLTDKGRTYTTELRG